MTRRVRSSAAALVPALALSLTLLSAGPAHADDSLVSLGPAPLTPDVASDLASLDPASPYGAFVHFLGGLESDHRRALAGAGLNIIADYPQIGAYYAIGNAGDFRVLTWLVGIQLIEGNVPIVFHGDTGVWATRARAAQEPVAGGPYRDAGGAVLDGSGVGVAVIDSGVNGAHPDLSDRIGANYKVVCSTPLLINTTTQQCAGPIEFVDVGTTTSDTSSGHGTHVSGIAVGDGTASTGGFTGARPAVQGTYTGVAPGATLYGFGTGEGDRILYPIEALQFITDNFDSFDPPIRVINNSWGNANGSAYNPNTVISKLIRDLVQDRGVTVVFSASNLGATEVESPTVDQTSGYSKDPTPGVISVANYDDDELGRRDGALSGGSSTGRVGADNTYPDVSAPGTTIAASCVREVQPICNFGFVDEVRWAPWYASISGTSMAAPHVAGAAALLYQAVPSITSAEVEDVFQDTAHKFSAGGAYTADPQNTGSTHAYDKGAGLLDVKAALDALGVAHDGSGEDAMPAVRVVEPAVGSDFDGTSQIAVSGTADDGTIPPALPLTVTAFDGEAGDFSGPGAADLVGLRVQETPAGATPAGVTYTFTVRNAADFGGGPATPTISLRVTQIVNGASFLSDVTTTPATVTPTASSSAPATSASRNGNDISMFVPFANLGNPPGGTLGTSVFASSFIGGIVDVAPSPQDGSSTGGDVFARPMFGRPYDVVRPQILPPPTVAVRYAVDGGLPKDATVTGSSPDYTWSGSIDPAPLTDGSHTLTATLFLNGVPATTHSTTFTITRVSSFVYDVTLSAPEDGTTVPRAVVLVRGTSFTDDPALDRAVTLSLAPPLGASQPIPVLGESPWTAEVDFSERFPGPYTLTARLLVGGVVKASDSIGVLVPTGGDTACSPRNIDFWRGQFQKNSESLRFSSAEADQLSARAATLSDGYFSNSKKLQTELKGSGNQPEKAAARQYASLLLNLAAGDLANDMSYRAGLAGYERLDPAVYTTAVVGQDVNAAAAWMRAQFPDRSEGGNLGGVGEVANAINNGQGLEC